MVVLSIAIPAVVFLALLLVFAASRRNEAVKAEGHLSKETLQRDVGSETSETTESEISQISGKEIERAAVLERQGGKEIVLQEQVDMTEGERISDLLAEAFDVDFDFETSFL